jgi:hypothetical protein
MLMLITFNPKGELKLEVPVISAQGKTVIGLKPEYKTVWYEIEIN